MNLGVVLELTSSKSCGSGTTKNCEAFSGWIRMPTPRALNPEVPTITVEVSVLVAKDTLVQAIAIRSVSDLSA
jgi:hypothetical protein